MEIFRALAGLSLLLLIAFLFSNYKRGISWKLVAGGVTLQIFLGILILKIDFFENIFRLISGAFVKVLSFAGEGAAFLFGDLAGNNFGFIFAFQVLPIIIFFSSLSAGLYYLGVLQKVVYGLAWLMKRTMRLSGPESLSAAGNVFLGQTEAPLLVRPFIARMTLSELMCLMTGGMATIAGSVLAGYVFFLGGESEAEQTRFAAYLLSASIMNAPAAIVVAKIMVPERNPEQIQEDLKIEESELGVNLLDAITRGASDGLKLALNVGAMLLVFIAIIAGINFVLSDLIGNWTGLNEMVASSSDGLFDRFSLEYLLGQIFRVFAFVIGINWEESLVVGSLIGQKTVINEFVAYLSLSEIKAEGTLSEKSVVIATYALCGFSNFASIAIQIGGIGGMAPNQQGNLSRLGLKALIGATIACLMTATLAGVLLF